MLGKAVYQLPLTTLLDRADKQWGDLSSGVAFLKFIYSEKATKFCERSTLLLSVCTVYKSKVEISQNFVAFSECMNFILMCVQRFHEILY